MMMVDLGEGGGKLLTGSRGKSRCAWGLWV